MIPCVCVRISIPEREKEQEEEKEVSKKSGKFEGSDVSLCLSVLTVAEERVNKQWGVPRPVPLQGR